MERLEKEQVLLQTDQESSATSLPPFQTDEQSVTNNEEDDNNSECVEVLRGHR